MSRHRVLGTYQYLNALDFRRVAFACDSLDTRSHKINGAFKRPDDEMYLSYCFFSVLTTWNHVKCRSLVGIISE